MAARSSDIHSFCVNSKFCQEHWFVRCRLKLRGKKWCWDEFIFCFPKKIRIFTSADSLFLSTLPKPKSLWTTKAETHTFPLLDFQEQQEYSSNLSKKWSDTLGNILFLKHHLYKLLFKYISSASLGTLLSPLVQSNLEEFSLGRKISPRDGYLSNSDNLQLNCWSANCYPSANKYGKDPGMQLLQGTDTVYI